jgi:hypothetical protein
MNIFDAAATPVSKMDAQPVDNRSTVNIRDNRIFLYMQSPFKRRQN